MTMPVNGAPRSRERSAALLSAPVARTLVRLAAPTTLGMLAIFLFQTVDTYFVGQLGVLPLAAMGFSAPLTFVVLSASFGIGVGATAVIARAIGAGDEHQVRRLTTDALLLGLAIVVALGVVGVLTLEPLFSAMGATATTLPLIAQYMVPWYLGVGFLVIPMVGNSALRATGDTKTPMVIMLISGLVNLVLDPLLIFGWGPFPRLELRGAAIATVLAWAVTFVAALGVLHFRERMLDFSMPRFGVVLASWRRITRIGLPAASANVLTPISAAVITALVARFGEDAVAAYGVGARVDMVATVGLHALAIAMTPFAAQNFGAQRFDRIRSALRSGALLSLAWGVGATVLLALVALPIASAFSGADAVISDSVRYLRSVPISYGLFGCAMLCSALFNALGNPQRAFAVIAMRSIGLAVPLAWLGASLGGVQGLFWGICAANGAAGLLALAYATHFLKRSGYI